MTIAMYKSTKNIPLFTRQFMAKSNIRGPYTMLELSQITRLSIETLRHYQQIGVKIPIGTSKQPEEQEIMSNIPSNTARIEINPVTYL